MTTDWEPERQTAGGRRLTALDAQNDLVLRITCTLQKRWRPPGPPSNMYSWATASRFEITTRQSSKRGRCYSQGERRGGVASGLLPAALGGAGAKNQESWVGRVGVWRR